jgi:hypothetical protein
MYKMGLASDPLTAKLLAAHPDSWPVDLGVDKNGHPIVDGDVF